MKGLSKGRFDETFAGEDDKLWKSWKTRKITKKSSMHAKSWNLKKMNNQ